MHCNTVYEDTYDLARHIKEISGYNDILDLRLEDASREGMLYTYLDVGNFKDTNEK